MPRRKKKGVFHSPATVIPYPYRLKKKNREKRRGHKKSRCVQQMCTGGAQHDPASWDGSWREVFADLDMRRRGRVADSIRLGLAGVMSVRVEPVDGRAEEAQAVNNLLRVGQSGSLCQLPTWEWVGDVRRGL